MHIYIYSFSQDVSKETHETMGHLWLVGFQKPFFQFLLVISNFSTVVIYYI